MQPMTTVASPAVVRTQGLMKTTHYYQTSVLSRRPYLKEEWIVHILQHPFHIEVQGNGRIRRWDLIAERGKYLRVIHGGRRGNRT